LIKYCIFSAGPETKLLALLKLLAIMVRKETRLNSSLEYKNHIASGFPSPAMDHLQPRIDLNTEFIKNPLATFIVECEGNSMVNAFIPPKARLIVDRSVTAANGDIILAILNGEFIIRRLIKNPYKSFLRPENNKYKEIEITAELDMTIWGVVTYIITDTKLLK
jgi:DNA polymerase V